MARKFTWITPGSIGVELISQNDGWFNYMVWTVEDGWDTLLVQVVTEDAHEAIEQYYELLNSAAHCRR